MLDDLLNHPSSQHTALACQLAGCYRRRMCDSAMAFHVPYDRHNHARRVCQANTAGNDDGTGRPLALRLKHMGEEGQRHHQ